MNWKDILQDFDVVVSSHIARNDCKVTTRWLYTNGLLYDTGDEYRYISVDDIEEWREKVVGVYRINTNAKTLALRGAIDAMEKIYPKEYKNYKVILQFTGDTDKYKGTMSRELWDNVKEDHDKIQYVLIVDEEGNKDIAELVSVEELTDSEYNYKAVNVFIV